LSLLQIQIDDKLKKAIQEKAEKYGVPSSSLIRITLVKAFLDDEPWVEGNVFNAHRDNEGRGIPIDDLISML
jgi:predicted transcriptional regulator